MFSPRLQVNFWRRLYDKYGLTSSLPDGLEEEVRQLSGPSNEWLIAEPVGLHLGIVWRICADTFPCWDPERNLLAEISEIERRDVSELQFELYPQGTEHSDAMTLRRRLLLAIIQFELSGRKLWVPTEWLACRGSRMVNGDVPGIRLFQGKLCAEWVYRRVPQLTASS